MTAEHTAHAKPNTQHVKHMQRKDGHYVEVNSTKTLHKLRQSRTMTNWQTHTRQELGMPKKAQTEKVRSEADLHAYARRKLECDQVK